MIPFLASFRRSRVDASQLLIGHISVAIGTRRLSIIPRLSSHLCRLARMILIENKHVIGSAICMTVDGGINPRRSQNIGGSCGSNSAGSPPFVLRCTRILARCSTACWGSVISQRADLNVEVSSQCRRLSTTSSSVPVKRLVTTGPTTTCTLDRWHAICSLLCALIIGP